MSIVSVGDADLFVAESGSGSEVVVLHSGLGYASWCWEPLMDLLGDRYRVLAVDTRGAGRSSKPEGPYSIDLFADDVAAVAEEMSTGPVHMVGHSMGGFVAQRFAAIHPNLANTITLIATHPGQPGALGVPESTLQLWEEASSLDAAGYARTTFATSFRAGWAEDNAERFEELLAARLEFPTPPERWRDHFNAGAAFADSEWATEDIEQPALVVQGSDDRVVPFPNAELLMSRLPNARLAVFEGAGHNLILEEPKKLAGVLAEFIGDPS